MNNKYPVSRFKKNPNWTSWNNMQNEGMLGYNPHTQETPRTKEELTNELISRGLTPDNTQEKRLAFNASVRARKELRRSEVPALCEKAGFQFLQDLKLAIEVYNL